MAGEGEWVVVGGKDPLFTEGATTKGSTNIVSQGMG